MPIPTPLKTRIIFLANKYETPAFLERDPSRFMHEYTDVRDRECAAFIAACTAFGRREQILSHVARILDAAGAHPAEWIQRGGYRELFTGGAASFYRMYTHNDYLIFCDTLREMLDAAPAIGEYVRRRHERVFAPSEAKHRGGGYLHETICAIFPQDCALVPHTPTSAAKRINMLLRWMVRDGSPVDLGLWSSWYDKGRLLLPLDTHVMHTAAEWGLLRATSSGRPPAATLGAAVSLTALMNEVFPGDPARADYALFGYGVESAD